MKIDKVEKQIRKISNLVDSIKEDDKVSSIEKDLLLAYTRKLYEKILGAEEETEKVKKIVKETFKHEVPTQQAEKVKTSRPVIEDIVREEIGQPIPRRESPDAIIHTASIPVEKAVSTFDTIDDNINSVQSDLDEAPMPDSMVEIFSKSSISDISDKLSNSPIKDLSKSMGINEKIFTIQELFGGDSELFNTTINRLNQAASFDSAQSYLVSGVAKDQKWDDVTKQKKAITFIKLVQRRFA